MEATTKTNYKRSFAIAKIKVGIIIPLVLLILPSDYFDDGQSICLSVMLLKVECYGCGITRAIMHLLHGDFSEAYYYNVLSFIVLPLLAFLWIKGIHKSIKFVRTKPHFGE
jgi:Protein of unknown function (DUF2752)